MQRVIDSVDEYLFQLSAPQEFNFSSENNILRELDLSFENLCACLEEAGIKEPKNLTVFELNQRVDYFEKKKPPEIR